VFYNITYTTTTSVSKPNSISLTFIIQIPLHNIINSHANN